MRRRLLLPDEAEPPLSQHLRRIKAVFAPEELGEPGAVLRAPWPLSNPELAKETEIEIPVQINGKLVTVVRVTADREKIGQMRFDVAFEDFEFFDFGKRLTADGIGSDAFDLQGQ